MLNEPRRRTRPRIIPLLLLRGDGLFKSRRFAAERYIGDPLNAVRIFTEKEADELIILDAMATVQGRGPDLARLADLAAEALMPLCYGGGIRSLDDIAAVLQLGVEKVCLGTVAVEQPTLIRAAADRFGSQSIVVCCDVRRHWWRGREVVIRRGRQQVPGGVLAYLERVVALGAGEIVVQAIDRDGMMAGYDVDLIRAAVAAVPVPVIALGGAASTADFAAILRTGAAAAAGSAFVFHGPRRAVLITYPDGQAFADLSAVVVPP